MIESYLSYVEKTPVLSQIFEPIRADLEQVDREFGRQVESQVELIPTIGRYIQSSGGKRVRPAILLMASRLGGYTGDRAVTFAAAIEFIHAAKESDLATLAPIYGESQLFAGHPYGRSVDGSEASLAAIKHADLQRYYQEQVGADRLIISVAGDFKTAQLKQRISRAFSGWRKAGAPLAQTPKAQRVASRRVLLVDAPDSVQSYFWAGNVAVAKNDPRRPALDCGSGLP